MKRGSRVRSLMSSYFNSHHGRPPPSHSAQTYGAGTENHPQTFLLSDVAKFHDICLAAPSQIVPAEIQPNSNKDTRRRCLNPSPWPFADDCANILRAHALHGLRRSGSESARRRAGNHSCRWRRCVWLARRQATAEPSRTRYKTTTRISVAVSHDNIGPRFQRFVFSQLFHGSRRTR